MPDTGLIEPMLVETARHVQLAAATEEERLTFNLADDQAIAIWGWEMGFPSAFPPVDQQMNMALSLDPDVNFATIDDAYADSSTIGRVSINMDLITTGSRTEHNIERQFFPTPIITVEDMTFVTSGNNAGLILTCAVFFQNIRLDDRALVRQIVRRR